MGGVRCALAGNRTACRHVLHDSGVLPARIAGVTRGAILASQATPTVTFALAQSDMYSASSDPIPDLRARFDAVVTPHLDRLLAFAIRRSDSVADAEDAVQEAFVRAWLGFADLRDDANARAWIYRILRTVLSDTREKSGRRQQLVFITRLEDAHDELIGGEKEALFSEVVSRLDGEAVHRALAKIPEDFAVAVELHDIDGFKYAEIADIVGVPIGTVMSRISRGRKLLAGAIMSDRSTTVAEASADDLAQRRVMRGGPR
jgi:RNA polymerase sigma-70 factor, ECF subfamily